MEAQTATTIRHLIGVGHTEAALRTLQTWAQYEAPEEIKNQCVLVQARWEQLQRDHIAGLLSDAEVDKRTNQINASLLTLLDNSAQWALIPAPKPRRALSAWVWLPILGILALFALVFWVWRNNQKPAEQVLVNTSPARTARQGAETTGRAISWPDGKVTNVVRGSGHVIRYEVLESTLEPFNNAVQKLTLRIRCQNNGQYDINFWDSTFRLLLPDAQRLAPNSNLNELVSSQSFKDGTVWFEVPKGVRAAQLEILSGYEPVTLAMTW